MAPPHYDGAERQENGEAKAERVVREGLSKLCWTEADLAQRRKGDPGKVSTGKVSIARRLRQETTVLRSTQRTGAGAGAEQARSQW